MSVLCRSSRWLVCLAIGWGFTSINVGVVAAHAVANELTDHQVETRDWRLLVVVGTMLLIIILSLAIRQWRRWSRQHHEPQAFVPPPIVLPPLIDDDSDSDQPAKPEK